MERGLILLVSAVLMVSLVPHVRGTAHLTFSNSTQTNITRDGCGTTKLCVESPDDCDPSSNSACLFASVAATTAVAPNGTDLTVEVRGETTGYLGCGFTANITTGTTLLFVCGQNSTSNATFFMTLLRNNTDNTLTTTETITNGIVVEVNDSIARCEFVVPGVNASMTRATTDTTFNILLGTGPIEGSSFGTFNVTLNSGSLDITNASSNVVSTTASPNTTTTNSTSGSYGGPQYQGMLLFLSLVTLPMMFKA